MREGETVKRTTCWMVVALLIGAGLGVAGQVPSTVLDIDPGVAVLGSGAAGLSLVHGAETLYYNPAGMAAVEGASFSSTLSSHMGLGSYSAFSLSFGSFGAALLLLNSGDIQGYDSSGQPSELLSYGSSSIMLGGGISPTTVGFLPSIGFDYAIGGRVKTVSSNIAGESGSGFAFDLGFLAGFQDIRMSAFSVSQIAFGVTAENLFGSISYDGDREGFPMGLNLGASALIANVVRASIDARLTGAFHIGLAYAPVPTLELRLGLISRGAVTSITGGLGVGVQGFLVDYAFKSHTLGASHRVSLTLDFSSLNLGGIGQMIGRILP